MRLVRVAIVLMMAPGCWANAPVDHVSQRKIDGPGGVLLVDDGGAGDRVPVVLLHSLAGNAAQWTPQLTHLRRAGRAIAVDLRGHGRSEAPKDGRFTLADYADDARQVLDVLRIERVVVVGHSFGGGVAVTFVGRWPDRVAGLLLVDPIDDPSKRPVDASFEAFMRQLEGPAYEETITGYWSGILKGANDAVRRQVLSDLQATPKTTVVGSMRAMAGFDPLAALARYRGPMLTVTTSLNDSPSSLQNVVTNLRHERVNDVSHWLHLDRPDAFNAILDRFLAEAQK